MLESTVAYFLRMPQLCFSHILLSGPSISCHYCLCTAQFWFLIPLFIPGRGLWLATFGSSKGPDCSRCFTLYCWPFVFIHDWSVQDCSQYSATILILIFKLSSGYLLAVFDPEVRMMLHCFRLLLPAQSWNPECFVAVSLVIIWYSFLCVSDLVLFGLEAQEFILPLKSRNFTGIYLSVVHPSCQWFDPPHS